MIYIVIAITCVVVDQILKKYATTHFSNQRKRQGVFTFSLVKNYGAFRGLFKNKPRFLKGFQIGATLFVGGLLVESIVSDRSRLIKLGLAMLIGGAIGNLIDRMKKGYVTDFFAVKWTKNLYYNLADVFVFLGSILTIIGELRRS